MEFVYVILENGEAYPSAYTTYAAAVRVVNEKHQDELNRQIEENPEYKDEIVADVNPPENPDGLTSLFIEKETRILIHKLPVVKTVGGRRRGRSRSRK